MNKQDKRFMVAVSFILVAISGVALTHVIAQNQLDKAPAIVAPILDITDVPVIEETHPTDEEIEDAILEDMATAFAIVESGNNVAAWNKKEDAVGCLQIRDIMRRHANGILGEEFFKPEDRWDRNMSFYLFEIVQRHDNPTLDIDVACDVWNPNCPRSYRDAVKTQFFLIQFKKMNGNQWVDEHMDSIVTMLKEMNIKPINLIAK